MLVTNLARELKAFDKVLSSRNPIIDVTIGRAESSEHEHSRCLSPARQASPSPYSADALASA